MGALELIHVLSFIFFLLPRNAHLLEWILHTKFAYDRGVTKSSLQSLSGFGFGVGTLKLDPTVPFFEAPLAFTHVFYLHVDFLIGLIMRFDFVDQMLDFVFIIRDLTHEDAFLANFNPSNWLSIHSLFRGNKLRHFFSRIGFGVALVCKQVFEARDFFVIFVFLICASPPRSRCWKPILGLLFSRNKLFATTQTRLSAGFATA